MPTKSGSLLEAHKKLWGTKNAITATINIIKGMNLIISLLSFAKKFIAPPSFCACEKLLKVYFMGTYLLIPIIANIFIKYKNNLVFSGNFKYKTKFVKKDWQIRFTYLFCGFIIKLSKKICRG
jgi:hypothetical protein